MFPQTQKQRNFGGAFSISRCQISLPQEFCAMDKGRLRAKAIRGRRRRCRGENAGPSMAPRPEQRLSAFNSLKFL